MSAPKRTLIHTRRKSDQFVVESQQLDGTDRKYVITIPDHVERIAYDWIGLNIYWMTVRQIGLTSLVNTTYHKTLVHDVQAVSLALNSDSGHMYWSVWETENGNNGRIEQSWMDGTHREALVNASKSGPMRFPTSLTVDLLERKLFWCDLSTLRIERVSLDGSDREVILMAGSGKWMYPYSVAYYNHFLFWCDQDMTIYRLHMNNTSAVDVSK